MPVLESHAAERRRLTTALVGSMGVHVFGMIVIGLIVAHADDAIQVPRGHVVELVQLPEPEPEPMPEVVEQPVTGVESPRGEVPVPRERRIPEVKPETRRPRRTPREPRTLEAPPDAPVSPVPPPPEPEKGAGGRLETEVAFPYAYYTEAVTRLITERWTPLVGTPDGAKAVVTFRIARDGTASNVAIDESSGISDFDAVALQAVRLVPKFPPLPAGFEWDDLRIRFFFEYRRGY